VSKLLEQIKLSYEGEDVKDEDAFEAARAAYEGEMVERKEIAVLASRRACLDAHEYVRINENSPLVKRRMMRTDLEE
jgi:hypothetical protein